MNFIKTSIKDEVISIIDNAKNESIKDKSSSLFVKKRFSSLS